MLGPSFFTPGTVLWLPKEKDVGTLDTYYNINVPDKCFGHPILVLGAERSTKYVTILIITSFGGGENIYHRIKNRGHEHEDYVPIHPSKCLVLETPTLRLRSSKEFNKRGWVHIQPYCCPKAWLQKTWASVWRGGQRGEGIEHRSLHALALYATKRGYNSLAYEKLLEIHESPMLSPIVLPEPGSIFISTIEGGTVGVSNFIDQPGIVTYGSLNSPPSRLHHDGRSWHAPRESEPLLPRTNTEPLPTSRSLQKKALLEWVWDKMGVFVPYLICVIKFLAGVALIIGVPYLGYLAIRWLLAGLKGIILSFASTIWAKLGEMKVGIWQGLDKLFERLTAWVKRLVS